MSHANRQISPDQWARLDSCRFNKWKVHIKHEWCASMIVDRIYMISMLKWLCSYDIYIEHDVMMLYDTCMLCVRCYHWVAAHPLQKFSPKANKGRLQVSRADFCLAGWHRGYPHPQRLFLSTCRYQRALRILMYEFKCNFCYSQYSISACISLSGLSSEKVF